MKQPQEFPPVALDKYQKSDDQERTRRSLPHLTTEEALAQTRSFRAMFRLLPSAGLDHAGFMVFYEARAFGISLQVVSSEELQRDHSERLALYLASAALGDYNLPQAETYLNGSHEHSELTAVLAYLQGLTALLKGRERDAERAFAEFEAHRTELPREFQAWQEEIHSLWNPSGSAQG